MGICLHSGTGFPKTRVTRKYCTPRCKTNACLERRPRRIRAADVEALQALLDVETVSVDELRERLRAILAPQRPPIAALAAVPRLD